MSGKIDGRKAVVVNSGKIYSTNTDFAMRYGYPDAAHSIWDGMADKRSPLANGEEVTLLVSGPHSSHRNVPILWIVEKPNGDRYIIGEDGLDFIKEPDVLALIANLSTRLTEVERKLAKVDGMEPPAPVKQERLQTKPLTRDDVIALAKENVEVLTIRYSSPSARTEFVVNRGKRTVVALRYYCGMVVNRGIAKCAPDDTFNVHIGRAIALRRALGLDVPDYYVNAPKPTEARVGDVVLFRSVVSDRSFVTTLTERCPHNDGDEAYGNNAFYHSKCGGWIADKQYTVIDDSREEV